MLRTNLGFLNIRLGRVPPPWQSQLANIAINYLPFALIPTAPLITYHAAGFSWAKKRKLMAEPAEPVRESAPKR